MNPAQLSAAIHAALSAAVENGDLVIAHIPDVTVERPRVREHGDYATSVALKLTKQANLPPREIAQIIAERLVKVDGIAGVAIAGPGFLNIRLAAAAAGVLVGQILEAGTSYGNGTTLQGKR